MAEKHPYLDAPKDTKIKQQLARDIEAAKSGGMEGDPSRPGMQQKPQWKKP